MTSFFVGIAFGVLLCGSAFMAWITRQREVADVDEWTENFYQVNDLRDEPRVVTRINIHERKIEL